MKFFFDNNLSRKLSNGLREFGEDVLHLQDELSADIDDVEMLKHVGDKGYILITKDEGLRWKPNEKKALKMNKIGLFFVSGKQMSAWQIILQIVANWSDIKELTSKTKKPFAFKIPQKGKKFTSYPID